MQVQILHLVKRKDKNKSNSFLNVHDGQTVLVHGTKAELSSWLQRKKEILGLVCTSMTGQHNL